MSQPKESIASTTYVDDIVGKSTILWTGGVIKVLGTQIILESPAVSISKTIESPKQIIGSEGAV